MADDDDLFSGLGGRQQKYVEARLVHRMDERSAARAAGYSDLTRISEIEPPGGPVANAIQKALNAQGLTDEFLAEEYAKGIKESVRGLEPDFNAHSKYLLQLGYLRGHGKNQNPQVAVQINNSNGTAPGQGGPQGYDLRRVEETLGEVRSILGLVREELGGREPSPVHAEDNPLAGRDQLHRGPGSHPGVGEAGGPSRQTPGGGQP